MSANIPTIVQNFAIDKSTVPTNTDIHFSGKLVRSDVNAGIQNVIINFEINGQEIGESASTDSNGIFSGTLRLSIPGTYTIVAVFKGVAVPLSGIPTEPIFVVVWCSLTGAFGFDACPRTIVSNVTKKAYRMTEETDRLVRTNAVPIISVPAAPSNAPQIAKQWLEQHGYEHGTNEEGFDPYDALKDGSIFAIEKSLGWIQVLDVNMPSIVQPKQQIQLTAMIQNVGSKDLIGIQVRFIVDNEGVLINSALIDVPKVSALQTMTVIGPTTTMPLAGSGTIKIDILACQPDQSVCSGNNIAEDDRSSYAFTKTYTVASQGSAVFVALGGFSNFSDQLQISNFLSGTTTSGVVVSQVTGKFYPMDSSFGSGIAYVDPKIPVLVRQLIQAGKITDIRVVHVLGQGGTQAAVSWAVSNGLARGAASITSFTQDAGIAALLS